MTVFYQRLNFVIGTTLTGALASGRALDPVSTQQPYFNDLRQAHVAEQREHKNWPVKPWQVREAQGRGQRGIRQPHAQSHDCCCCGRQRPTRTALQEGDFIGTNDVDDERLRHQRLDEPSGLK